MILSLPALALLTMMVSPVPGPQQSDQNPPAKHLTFKPLRLEDLSTYRLEKGGSAHVSLTSGPRYQNDPADSLYQQAKRLLNSYDYRAAAQRFKEVQQKYPNSNYVALAMYWQAFALYRNGTEPELREALAVLDARQQRFPNAEMADPSLTTRIRGALAARGDGAAREQLRQAATGTTASCDKEEQTVRSEALSALMRVDPDAAIPKLDQILAKRDECSRELRLYALQILMRRGDEKAVATLLATARSDPSAQMRAYAIEYIARFPSDETYATLETIARTERIASVQSAAARSLVGYPSARARQAARSLVEDNTVSDAVRAALLERFNDERGTSEDATWLRASYASVTSNPVKRAIVGAVGRIGGTESAKWLMDLSTNDQEPASIRATAFRLVATSMTVADLARGYDNAGSRPMRESIVRALNARKEPEATDKLVDIVRRGTDPEIRRIVIQMLTEKKDPKVTAALLELIDR